MASTAVRRNRAHTLSDEGPYAEELPAPPWPHTSGPSEESHRAESQKRGHGEDDQVPRLNEINECTHSDTLRRHCHTKPCFSPAPKTRRPLRQAQGKLGGTPALPKNRNFQATFSARGCFGAASIHSADRRIEWAVRTFVKGKSSGIYARN